MRRCGRIFWFCSALLGFSFGAKAQQEPPPNFIENKNQWHADFLYGVDFPGARIFLKKSSLFVMQYVENNSNTKTSSLPATDFNETHHRSNGIDLSTFEIEFLNTRQPGISSSVPGVSKYNYYIGNDRRTWAEGARSYGQINYAELYPGINLRVYSNGDQLKYDWLVDACADPNHILVKYSGVDRIYIENDNLVIGTRIGKVNESAPVAWQEVNGVRRFVQCRFRLDDDVVSFEFPDGYDSNYELVIDPTLIFFSYSGSTWDNWGNTATPDSKGNLYSGGIVSGFVGQSQYPVTAGAYQTNYGGGQWDVGIIKYDSTGANVLYTTYLGGVGTETPQSLVVDSNDNLLILGTTSSIGFPGTIPGSFQGGQSIDPIEGVLYGDGTDIFVAKLAQAGNTLMAATYIGGSSNDGVNFVSGNIGTPTNVQSPLGKNYGDQLRGDITVDAEDNVYIASNTMSNDFPISSLIPEGGYRGGTHDAVVAKFSPNLSQVLWSRLIGGANTDIALSIKVAPTGRLYVAGGTNSRNLIGMNGLHDGNQGDIDGWIYELSADGRDLVNGTYLGTTNYDQIYFIDLGTDGSVYAYGQTQGDWPISDNVFNQPGGGQFLHKLSHNLRTTMLSTVFGINNVGTSHPTPNISPTAFLVNECNNIYMAGWGGAINTPVVTRNRQEVVRNYVGGNTNNMATTTDAFQRNARGNDFYFMVLSANAANLVYATFLGGPQAPIHVDGGTSRFDKRGIVYHAVCAGCRGLNDFPGVNVPVNRMTNRSSGCNNAAFKFDLSSLDARIQTNTPRLDKPGLTKVCLPDPLVVQNKSINGKRFMWDMGDGTTRDIIDTLLFSHRYDKVGHYNVKLKIIDESTCINVDSTTVTIEVVQPNMTAGPDTRICEQSSTRLTGTGASTWQWRARDNSFSSDLAEPLVTPQRTTPYVVTMTDFNGCVKKDTLTVEVTPKVELQFEFELMNDCLAKPSVMLRNTSVAGENVETFFTLGDGTQSPEPEVTHQYKQDGLYNVTLTGIRESCAYTETKEVPFATFKIPNVITPSFTDGKNDQLRFLEAPQEVYGDWFKLGVKIYNRWGELVLNDPDYRGDWSAENVQGGVYFYQAENADDIVCKGWIHVIK
jgi:hypothetical protein